MSHAKIQLTGLDPDNVLAFLAMLGVLKALATEGPRLNPRICWRPAPLRAWLITTTALVAEEISSLANAGVARATATIAGFDFATKDIKFTPSEYAALCAAALAAQDTRVAAALAAMASDGALKRDGETLAATQLCLMFGQGHQHFIETLKAYAGPDPEGAASIRAALFENWLYADTGKSFRWDFAEDRRYALQFGNPSKTQNKLGCMRGANRLAALGFCSLVSSPCGHGLGTLGITGQRGDSELRWPLPGVPASADAIAALMGHPDLYDDANVPGLRAFGLIGIARAKRIQVQKFFNFERARLTLFPTPPASAPDHR